MIQEKQLTIGKKSRRNMFKHQKKIRFINNRKVGKMSSTTEYTGNINTHVREIHRIIINENCPYKGIGSNWNYSYEG